MSRGRRVRFFFALLLAPALAAIGTAVVDVAPAHASIAYQINPTDACRARFPGSFGSSLYKWSPDGIYCYTISIPLGITWSGALDKTQLYWYCQSKYGKTSQDRVEPGWLNPLNAWYCWQPD
jgi:hypothetical protein